MAAIPGESFTLNQGRFCVFAPGTSHSTQQDQEDHIMKTINFFLYTCFEKLEFYKGQHMILDQVHTPGQNHPCLLAVLCRLLLLPPGGHIEHRTNLSTDLVQFCSRRL